MEKIVQLDSMLALLSDQLLLQQGLDLFIKSSMIIGLAFLVATLFRKQLSNNSSHLLWLSSMLCVGLLPLGMLVLSLFPAVFLDTGPITVISISASSAASVGLDEQNWSALLGIGYALIASLLLLRLFLSAIALMRINTDSQLCSDESILRQSKHSCDALGISRVVAIKFSNAVASPMSFGLFKPVVILPPAASTWADSTIEDVLIHELAHIKRLDWPTMLFCHVLTSLLWANPLLWVAKNRVNEAAEQSCDAAVLRCGKDGSSYAEDLLRLAQESLKNKQVPLLAQLMFDESNLTMRIKNILDGTLIGRANRGFVTGLIVSTLLITSACSGVSLLGSNLKDQEMLPTNTAIPQYPTQAALQGIEGWTLVSFTVSAEGLVEKNSLKVVDAEPADIFNRTSIRAAEKFEFQPRIRNGKAVEIEGVQYVFRFDLEDDGDGQHEGQRPPPPARSRGV